MYAQVQSGFGRTGDHFWGFEGHGVIPDIGKLRRVQSDVTELNCMN